MWACFKNGPKPCGFCRWGHPPFWDKPNSFLNDLTRQASWLQTRIDAGEHLGISFCNVIHSCSSNGSKWVLMLNQIHLQCHINLVNWWFGLLAWAENSHGRAWNNGIKSPRFQLPPLQTTRSIMGFLKSGHINITPLTTHLSIRNSRYPSRIKLGF